MQRTYLDGMEADESVPLTFERHGGEGDEGVLAGLPEGFTPQAREADPAAVIDITAMLDGLESSRSGRR